MDQEKAFTRCMEIFSELEGLRAVTEAFREIVQDSPLKSQDEDGMMGRFLERIERVRLSWTVLKSVYIELINTLE